MITLTILLIIALLCVLVGCLTGLLTLVGVLASPFCGRAGGCAGRISGRALYGHGNFPWPQHPDGRAGQLCGRVFVRPAGHPRLRQLFFLCHFGNRCLHLHLGRPEDLQVSFFGSIRRRILLPELPGRVRRLCFSVQTKPPKTDFTSQLSGVSLLELLT